MLGSRSWVQSCVPRDRTEAAGAGSGPHSQRTGMCVGPRLLRPELHTHSAMPFGAPALFRLPAPPSRAMLICAGFWKPYRPAEPRVMTVEQIRKARQARPFKPFTLLTGGGREYRIPHPEFLWIIPPGRTIAVADTDGTAVILDLLLIESLNFSRPRSRRSNGRRRPEPTALLRPPPDVDFGQRRRGLRSPSFQQRPTRPRTVRSGIQSRPRRFIRPLRRGYRARRSPPCPQRRYPSSRRHPGPPRGSASRCRLPG